MDWQFYYRNFEYAGNFKQIKNGSFWVFSKVHEAIHDFEKNPVRSINNVAVMTSSKMETGEEKGQTNFFLLEDFIIHSCLPFSLLLCERPFALTLLKNSQPPTAAPVGKWSWLAAIYPTEG